MSNIIFISKDALNKGALPIYGNDYWKTPNIDELAQKGTVFRRHYAAAASTAMAFTSMSIGDYCYTTNRRRYENEDAINGNTLFDKIYDAGYECHIVWDESYTNFAKTHFRCEGLHTTIHSLSKIKQPVSKHTKGEFDDVSANDEETKIALCTIREKLLDIKTNAKKDIFIWMHLPHVMRGRQGYGSDIDVYDDIIGIARELFDDNDIYISADHGHMNGWKNKYHYGYDVEDEAICIPLITPKINGVSEINYPTSTIQMVDILLNRSINPLKYVISETAYYAQPKRKMAIIMGKYKYSYDKENNKEALYDIEFDKEEKHNLVYPEFYDVDRFVWYSTAQCFYYPYWDEAHKILEQMRQIKKEIWKNGNFIEEIENKILHKIKCIYLKYKLFKPNDEIENTGK